MQLRLLERPIRPTCLHEAGHAVAGRLLGAKVASVKVEGPDDGTCDVNLPAKDVNGWLIILAAGSVAVGLLWGRLPNDTWGQTGAAADDDWNLAVNLAGGEVQRVRVAEARAVVLCARHKDAIRAIAEALEQRGRLDQTDIDAILGTEN